MCLTADTKLCCCQLCGLLLISIPSCIFTHFLDTPEVSYCSDVASTEWLNNWYPKKFCTIFTFHLRWQFCSILWSQNDLNIELLNYDPFSQKKLLVILLAALSLFQWTFFLLINFMEIMNVLCAWVSHGKVMVLAVWQHVVWYTATNIF